MQWGRQSTFNINAHLIYFIVAMASLSPISPSITLHHQSLHHITSVSPYTPISSHTPRLPLLYRYRAMDSIAIECGKDIAPMAYHRSTVQYDTVLHYSMVSRHMFYRY
eukprot:360212_1